MISDSERRRLGEIEIGLRRDDPDLARQLDEWRPGPRQRPILAVLVVVAVGLIWVLCGTTAGVIALTSTGCLGAAAALRRERGHRRGRGDPTGPH
jgi:hypothetical protein